MRQFKPSLRLAVYSSTLAIALIMAVVTGSTEAKAYELETHCYDTYILARRVGFTREYAEFFCKGAQAVDEGVSSTPMAPTLLYGEMLRRIWHAPTYLFQKQTVTQDGHAKVQLTAAAEANHPVASKLLDEGLREGNWFKIALSIHVIEDSYGHSGFTTELLHLYTGHNPDRT